MRCGGADGWMQCAPNGLVFFNFIGMDTDSPHYMWRTTVVSSVFSETTR